MGSYILNNLNENELQNYLVENLFPHTLFGILKKNWELLNIYLKEIGIDNIQIFLNIIFDKLIEFIKNYLEFLKLLKFAGAIIEKIFFFLK